MAGASFSDETEKLTYSFRPNFIKVSSMLRRLEITPMVRPRALMDSKVGSTSSNRTNSLGTPMARFQIWEARHGDTSTPAPARRMRSYSIKNWSRSSFVRSLMCRRPFSLFIYSSAYR